MATTLQLVEGGTTTDLNDGSATRIVTPGGYTPQAADIGEATVRERAKIIITVATVALMDSTREAIILRLYNARARQTNHARDKTYVQFKPDGGADTWRSEILKGKIINEKDIHAEPWAIKKIEVTVEWVRRNYWEGSEAAVPLTNTNATDTTAGINVYNSNDGSGSPPNDRVNYVDIKAADVDGELPGATRIEAVSSYATDRLNRLMIGQNFTDPANHVWTYEGEDATGGTPTVDANSSGGDYNLVSVSSGPSFQDLLTWTIAGSVVDDAKGGMMKAVVRFSDALIADPAKIWWKIHLEVASATLFETGRIKIDDAHGIVHRDLATFNFPPWLRGQTGNADVDLVLEGQQETGGAVTAKIDVLYLIPADGWRYIRTNDRLLNTERLVDDGINDLIYVDDASGSDKRSASVGYGNPIQLEPGKLQRLYFVMEENQIDRLIVVKIFYRPRRHIL